MRRSRENRIIAAALRCYPARWRSRHGDEATALASPSWTTEPRGGPLPGVFLGGVAKERVFEGRVCGSVRRWPQSFSASRAVPLALFASLTPASASGTKITIVISKPGDAARQLESAFATHHLKITVVEEPVSTDVVGAILSVSTAGSSNGDAGAIREVHGRCNGGGAGCVVGLALPLHFSGSVRVTVGVATTSKGVRHSHLAQEPRIR